MVKGVTEFWMRGTIQGQGVDYFFPWFMAVIVERGGRE